MHSLVSPSKSKVTKDYQRLAKKRTKREQEPKKFKLLINYQKDTKTI